MYPAVGLVMLYYVVTASLAMVNMSADANQCMGEEGIRGFLSTHTHNTGKKGGRGRGFLSIHAIQGQRRGGGGSRPLFITPKSYVFTFYTCVCVSTEP